MIIQIYLLDGVMKYSLQAKMKIKNLLTLQIIVDMNK